MAAIFILIDLDDPSKHLYSVHSFCLGVTAISKVSLPKFEVNKKSQYLMQNGIKKILQYFYIYFIYAYTHTSVQNPIAFLREAIQSSVKCYVIENNYFSCSLGQSANIVALLFRHHKVNIGTW